MNIFISLKNSIEIQIYPVIEIFREKEDIQLLQLIYKLLRPQRPLDEREGGKSTIHLQYPYRSSSQQDRLLHTDTETDKHLVTFKNDQRLRPQKHLLANKVRGWSRPPILIINLIFILLCKVVRVFCLQLKISITNKQNKFSILWKPLWF